MLDSFSQSFKLNSPHITTLQNMYFYSRENPVVLISSKKLILKLMCYKDSIISLANFTIP